jgi:hypothetical protein
VLSVECVVCGRSNPHFARNCFPGDPGSGILFWGCVRGPPPHLGLWNLVSGGILFLTWSRRAGSHKIPNRVGLRPPASRFQRPVSSRRAGAGLQEAVSNQATNKLSGGVNHPSDQITDSLKTAPDSFWEALTRLDFVTYIVNVSIIH